MYIHNFLQSIVHLKGLAVPRFMEFKPLEGNVVYYDYIKKEDIEDTNNNYTGSVFMAFSNIDNPDKTCYINVDEYVNYIKLLEEEPFALKQGSMLTLDNTLYEAVWLFDELSKIDQFDHPFLDANITGGTNVADLIYKQYQPSSENSILSFFEGNPVKRDVFFAQFNYFIRKYCMEKININITNKTTLRKPHQFNRKITSSVESYMKNLTDTSSQHWYIQSDNTEFDNFIQQIRQFYDNEDSENLLLKQKTPIEFNEG